MDWTIVGLLALWLGALVWLFSLGRRVERLSRELINTQQRVRLTARIIEAQKRNMELLGWENGVRKKVDNASDINALMELYEEVIGGGGRDSGGVKKS